MGCKGTVMVMSIIIVIIVITTTQSGGPGETCHSSLNFSNVEIDVKVLLFISTHPNYEKHMKDP